ncbi:MAG: PIN domain-containing protein [Nitrococcus sp.]|nr:PIN domain-containing protein [Nitrococcus sp.]
MVIADTGFWLALGNRKDQHHELAQQRLFELEEPLITTWPVLTQTCHLLLQRLGHPAQLKFMQSYEAGAFEVFDLSQNHAPVLTKLMKKYASLPMDLADASLIVLAEHLGDGRILSTDQRDFKSYRWKQHKPFRNLLLRG